MSNLMRQRTGVKGPKLFSGAGRGTHREKDEARSMVSISY